MRMRLGRKVAGEPMVDENEVAIIRSRQCPKV